jgi:hypothetical protein
MPVNTGTIKPPKNRSNHIKKEKIRKLLMKGTGSADAIANAETNPVIFSAMGDS